ncbi:MAG: DUF2809 domain-containing protein [Bacteroidota bacterium]
MLRFQKNYFLLAVAFFIIEVLIALYVKDAFIRPYFGDYLVVMLVYCGVRSIVNTSVTPAAVFTLLFAYAVEYAQHLNLLGILGWEDHRLARIVLGSSFEWGDMLAYTLGVVTIVAVERLRQR